jgi:hypothetical protein
MPMTRQQAELAVDRDARLRGLGPNREASIQILMRFNPEEIPNRMPAGSPLVRNTARQTAISAAMGGPEEPRMVTPATPAPVRPGIPIMAPRPEARQLMPADVRQMAAREEAGTPEPEPEAAPAPARATPAPAAARPKSSYVSPARIAAEQSKRELDILNYNRAKTPEGSPVLADIDMAIDLAERRIAQQESIANAEEAATIDADRAALFEKQEGRLKGREEQIARDEKDVYADALIKGGLALMNPARGNNFLAALSEGLGQGLETYDVTKAKAVEARARLGAETDALALQKMDALAQARDTARKAVMDGKQLDEQSLRVMNLSNDAIKNIGTRQAEIQMAVANARKATTQADYEEQRILGDLTYQDRAGQAALMRGENSGSGGSGGTKPVTATANSDIKSLEKAENDAVKLMTDARRAWIAAGKPGSGQEVTDMRDANTALQTAMASRKGYLERLGLPYTEKNIPAKKAYRQEFGLEPKPGSRPAARPSGSPRPAGVGPDWTLKEDANGRKAWVSPDGKRFKEVR